MPFESWKTESLRRILQMRLERLRRAREEMNYWERDIIEVNVELDRRRVKESKAKG